MIHIASAINLLALGNQEDGTMAGEGLSALQTFAYFFVAPIAIFTVIIVVVLALTSDRKKKSASSVITSIE